MDSCFSRIRRRMLRFQTSPPVARPIHLHGMHRNLGHRSGPYYLPLRRALLLMPLLLLLLFARAWRGLRSMRIFVEDSPPAGPLPRCPAARRGFRRLQVELRGAHHRLIRPDMQRGHRGQVLVRSHRLPGPFGAPHLARARLTPCFRGLVTYESTTVPVHHCLSSGK